MSAIIETTIVRALAAELDRQMLAGSGSAEMTGILTDPGIGSTSGIGVIQWADLLTALADIEGNNHTPTSYICSPTISNDLNALTSGDGSNSAALWQGPPPGVDKLERFVTSNMPDTDILMGDFTRVILGLRQDALVEFTSTGGDAFAKHSVLFKVTWRGDVAIEDGGAFHDLAGITT
jgi:HK97 family phage major capsid protein